MKKLIKSLTITMLLSTVGFCADTDDGPAATTPRTERQRDNTPLSPAEVKTEARGMIDELSILRSNCFQHSENGDLSQLRESLSARTLVLEKLTSLVLANDPSLTDELSFSEAELRTANQEYEGEAYSSGGNIIPSSPPTFKYEGMSEGGIEFRRLVVVHNNKVVKFYSPLLVTHAMMFNGLRKIFATEMERYECIYTKVNGANLPTHDAHHVNFDELLELLALNRHLRNSSYENLLHSAGSSDVVRCLVEEVGIPVDSIHQSARTTLHLKVTLESMFDDRYLDIIKTLLMLGADTKNMDANGNTPYDYALSNLNEEQMKKFRDLTYDYKPQSQSPNDAAKTRGQLMTCFLLKSWGGIPFRMDRRAFLDSETSAREGIKTLYEQGISKFELEMLALKVAKGIVKPSEVTDELEKMKAPITRLDGEKTFLDMVLSYMTAPTKNSIERSIVHYLKEIGAKTSLEVFTSAVNAIQ